MPRIIAIANQKGGVGKTTTAVNLAAAFALAGGEAVLIDLDPQANATSGFGLEAGIDGSPHPLLDPGPLDQRLKPTAISGLRVLASSPALLNVEERLARDSQAHDRLYRAIRASHLDHATVIVDCPPSLGMLTQNALRAAGSVLIPIQCEYYAMEGLTRILSGIEQVRGSANRSLRIEGILLTMFDPRLDLCHEVAAEVRDYFGDVVFETMIPRDVALSEASSFGRSALEHALRSPGTLAYLKLAKEVMSDD